MILFAPIRAATVLILLVTGLFVACGEASDFSEPTRQSLAGTAQTASDLSVTPTTPGDTAEPDVPRVELSAPIVVPLDPDGGEQYKLYLIDTDGAPLRRLTPENSEIIGSESDPVWSLDGQRLVFVGYVGNGVDLFTINADGTDLRNLTNTAQHTIEPHWSPDGEQIVYVRSDADSQDIHIINADGSDSRQLTDGMEHESNPVWSPDGEWIAFLRSVFVPAISDSDRAATQEAGEDDSDADSQAAEGNVQTRICVMRPDGSDQRVLATSHFAEGLRWSPDGQQLAFSTFSDFSSNQHAQVVGLDGSEQRVLDNGTVESSLPSWSPDGSHVSAIVTDPGGSAASIVIMNADGSDAHSIADLAGWHAWSPDGSQILVAQGRVTVDGNPTGRSNLYIVSSADSEPGQVLILEDAAIGSDPAWQPMP